MAIRTPVVEYRPDGNVNLARVVWTGLLNGDTGGPVQLPEFPDRTVQVYGTFGAGGSINIEGSCDKTTETPTYFILSDPQGNAVTKTAAAAEAIEEAPLLIRPNVTAGDGTTSLTVKLVCRRPRV